MYWLYYDASDKQESGQLIAVAILLNSPGGSTKHATVRALLYILLLCSYISMTLRLFLGAHVYLRQCEGDATGACCLSVCLFVCLSVCHSVSRITHESVYGRRPNMVRMGKG